MPNHALIKNFMEAAQTWVCDDYAIDLRYICVRSDDAFHLVAASIGLSPVPHEKDVSFSVSTNNLKAGQKQIFPVSKDRMLEILGAAAEGRIEGDHGVFDLGSGGALGGTLSHYSEMSHRDRWYFPLHLRVVNEGNAQLGPEQILDIDAELRQAEPPFDGVSDLSIWLGLDADSGTQPRSITIRVLPPIELIFNETNVTADTLSVCLHAHPKVDVHQIHLAVRAAPGDGVPRASRSAI